MNKEKIISLLEAEAFNDAVPLLKEWAEVEPNSWEPWLYLSSVAMRTKNYEAGIMPFSKMVQLRPTNALASSGYFQCLCEMGAYDQAKEEMSRFKRVASPDNPDAFYVLQEQQEKAQRLGLT
ncbi:MAG: hypothetical protein PVG66_10480 [Chromatiales bacterium]|jgi:predicted Zn-dependent protease